MQTLFERVSLEGLAEFYLLHILITTIISFLISLSLKKRYDDKLIAIFVLAFVFNMVLPGIGYFFTLWMGYYLLYVYHPKRLKHAKVLNMQELDHQFPRVKRMFGEGSMLELMNNEHAPKHKKMKALSIMAENLSKKNIALIKHALLSKDDEIRLFSFSLLDNMEQNINTKVHKALERFDQAGDLHQKARMAKELAYLYWDMVYFDLMDDNLKEHV